MLDGFTFHILGKRKDIYMKENRIFEVYFIIWQQLKKPYI